MTIREFAKERGFEIVGKLVRHSELETMSDPYALEKVRDSSVKVYLDDAGNEYIISKKGMCIIDKEGGVF